MDSMRLSMSCLWSLQCPPSQHTSHTASQFRLRAFAPPVPAAQNSLPLDIDLSFKSLLKCICSVKSTLTTLFITNKLSLLAQTPYSIYPALGTLLPYLSSFKNLFIYLTALGLGYCSTWDLQSLLGHVRSRSSTSSYTRAPCIGSTES